MDIGSTKVDVHTQQTIPHHLIDIVDNTQQFTAGDYHERATVAIQVCNTGLMTCQCTKLHTHYVCTFSISYTYSGYYIKR